VLTHSYMWLFTAAAARKRIRRWQWTESCLPSGEASIKVYISGTGGDRQNLRLEIRGARSRSQVGG